jgi:hypothetical protein
LTKNGEEDIRKKKIANPKTLVRKEEENEKSKVHPNF